MDTMNGRAGAVRPSFLLTLILAVGACLIGYRWLTRDVDNLAFTAVDVGDVEAVEQLIAKRPRLLTENKYHSPNMIVIAALKHPDLLQMIAPVIHQGTRYRFQLWNSLSMAVRNQDMRSVNILLESGWNPNEGAVSSLLVEACRQQNPELIELLLANDVDTTPALSWACEQGDSKLAARLLALGADPSAPRALASAVANGDFELVNDLMLKGANPADGLIRINDQTPRDLIAGFLREGDFDLLDEDQQAEAIRNLFQIEDSEILDAVVSRVDLVNGVRASRAIVDLVECTSASNPLEKLDILMRHGATLDAVDPSTYDGTALHILATKANFQDDARISMVERLINAGADIDVTIDGPDAHFDTPLSRCLNQIASDEDEIDSAQVEIAKLLIDAGAATTKSRSGGTYLHYAANRQNPANEALLEIVSCLIAAEVDLRATDANGWTPLQMACQNGQAEIAKMLVDAGADFGPESENGETPLQLCERLIDQEDNADRVQRLKKTLQLFQE